MPRGTQTADSANAPMTTRVRPATESTPRRPRAKPMAPDQRRDAIIAATVPLVRTRGFDISTREIAEAAGIAEGTIFRVFDDKETLLRRAVEAALDPSDVERQLAGIYAGLPLDDRVRIAAEIMLRWLRRVIELATAIGPSRMPGDDETRQHHQARHLRILEDVFEPDRERLRFEPAEAARLLQMLTLAGAHPRLNQGRPLSASEITTVLLDGIRHRPDAGPGP